MDRRDPTGRLMTLDEYLTFEERSPSRHEYLAGEVYAMAGVTTRHNLITLNIAVALRGATRPHQCRVFATDVKLKAADRIYYPDVMLVCGRAAQVEQMVEEPYLVVEVTSPSTRAIDRREKLDTYRRIPSLGGYLIVDQRRRHVLAYLRASDGDWTRRELTGSDRFTVPGLAPPLALDAFYDGVTLPPLTVGEEWQEFDEEG